MSSCRALLFIHLIGSAESVWRRVEHHHELRDQEASVEGEPFREPRWLRLLIIKQATIIYR